MSEVVSDESIAWIKAQFKLMEEEMDASIARIEKRIADIKRAECARVGISELNLIKLRDLLLSREFEIANNIEDFGGLDMIFREIVGRWPNG